MEQIPSIYHDPRVYFNPFFTGVPAFDYCNSSTIYVININQLILKQK